MVNLGKVQVLLAALIATTSVAAHEAIPTSDMPKGWTYPMSCCAGYDCREVPASAIGEKKAGYVILRTGEVIPYGDSRLRDSPDGIFHWCSRMGSDTGNTICLYVPPRGF